MPYDKAKGEKINPRGNLLRNGGGPQRPYGVGWQRQDPGLFKEFCFPSLSLSLFFFFFASVDHFRNL